MRQFALLFIIAIFSACFGTEPQNTGLEGKPLPEFSLLLPDSNTLVNTRDIAVGKPIALFFFSPYCPYCSEQTKEILDDMDKLKDIQFYFVTRFPVQALREFNTKYQLEKYNNITTGVDMVDFVSNYFEIPGVPYIAVYKKDKTLGKAFLGKVYSSQLKKSAEE